MEATKRTTGGKSGGQSGDDAAALDRFFWNAWDPKPKPAAGWDGGGGAATTASTPAAPTASAPLSLPEAGGGDLAELSAALEAQLQEYVAIPHTYLARRAAPTSGDVEEARTDGAAEVPSSSPGKRAPSSTGDELRALYDDCVTRPGEFHVKEVADQLLRRAEALLMHAGVPPDDCARQLHDALVVPPAALNKKYRQRGAEDGDAAQKANEFLLQIVLRFALARLQGQALQTQDKPVLKELNSLLKGVMFHVHLPGHQWGLKPFFEFVLLPEYGEESLPVVLKLAKKFGVDLPPPERGASAPEGEKENLRDNEVTEADVDEEAGKAEARPLLGRRNPKRRRQEDFGAGKVEEGGEGEGLSPKKSPLRELVDMVRVPPMASKLASNAGALLRQISVKVKRVSFGDTPRGALGRRSAQATPLSQPPPKVRAQAGGVSMVMETPYKAPTPRAQSQPTPAAALPRRRAEPGRRSLGL